MDGPAIQIEGLGKRYSLARSPGGNARSNYRRFSDLLTMAAAAPFGWLRGNAPRSKREDFWALQDIDLKIGHGEVVGIVGRNGAGKSTLLKILSRITDPTVGRIEMDGRVASLLEVGTGFHPELTGRENIFLNGAILGMSRREISRKFDEIVAFSEVERFLDTPVKRYSSGMYVRLAFAVAAHLESEILVVDEVLAVGDSGFQRKCLQKMEGISRDGRTILFVSHNLGTVVELCERAICLNQGRVVADDRADKVVEYYQNSGLIQTSGWSRPSSRPAAAAISFLAAGAVNAEGVPVASFACDELIRISIDYQITENLNDAIVTAKIENARGVFIFETGDADAEGVTGLARSPGRYRASFKIQPYFLSPGAFYLSLGAGILGYTAFEIIPHVIAFEVLEARPVQASSRRTPGAVSPKLPWSLEKLL